MLLELINQILDLASIEKGHMQLTLSEIRLSTLLSECRAMVSPLARLDNITLNIHSEISGYVIADYTRLKQVILNVLSNAIKYNRKGGTVTLESRQQADSVVQIRITDTGKGISRELQQHIFQPFYRLNTAGSIEGTGIGLSISKQLLEMMNGKIYVTSKIDEGSCFCIELSGRLDPEATLAADNLHAISSLPTITAPAPAHNILVAEDNATNQTLLVCQLEALGYTADIADNGQQALNKLHEKHYDLLLTDCNMPLLNGYELAINARQQGYTLPIIAITADAFPETATRCIDAGMNDHITKPVELATLKNTVAKYLAASSAAN
jgi:CheY-like chemotaxis protein